MGEWPTRAVTEFRGRALPEPGELVGYAALIARYDLVLPLPVQTAAIADRHHPASTPDWLMLTPRHRPEATLAAQLTLALRYEGVDLQVLSKLFDQVAPDDIVAIVRATPTGAFARRLWFLYEWLTGRQLDLPDPGKVRLVPMLDTDQQYALAAAEPSPRRVKKRGGLVGPPRFWLTSEDQHSWLEVGMVEAAMSQVRVAGFSVSLDGFGAGPEQSLEHPLGRRGQELHQWIFGTRFFQTMIGQDGGSDGVD